MTARKPWFPADYDIADVAAIQALVAGQATADQQKRALRWIVESASGAYDQSFVPGEPDVMAFLEGRRSVGNQIVKLMKLDRAALQKAQPKEPAAPKTKGTKQ